MGAGWNAIVCDFIGCFEACGGGRAIGASSSSRLLELLSSSVEVGLGATCPLSVDLDDILAIFLELCIAVGVLVRLVCLDGAGLSAGESLSLSTNSWLKGNLDTASCSLDLAKEPGSGTGVRLIPFIMCLQSHSPFDQRSKPWNFSEAGFSVQALLVSRKTLAFLGPVQPPHFTCSQGRRQAYRIFLLSTARITTTTLTS